MKKKISLLLIAISILLIYWNNEIYKHRVNMKEAESAFEQGDFNTSLDYLKKASVFPFHIKTEPYILNVKKNQYEKHFLLLNERNNRVKEMDDYVKWVESEVLISISEAYEKYDFHGEYNAKQMNKLFYRLNFILQEKEVKLNPKFTEVHSKLIDYVNSNQLAYGSWDRNESLAAETFRQEAIASYTEFRKELNAFSTNECGKTYDLSIYTY